MGIDDPHLLGQALFMAVFALYFRLTPGVGSAALLAVLVTLSLLTKHNMLALPAVMSFDLLIRWPWRAKITYVATGIAAAAISFLIIWLVIGDTFFVQVFEFSSRALDPARGFLMTTAMVGKLESALATVGLVLILNRKVRPYGLIGVFLLVALAEGAVFTSGANDDINHFFEIFAALSIGAGLALHWVGRRFEAPAASIVLALLIQAGILFNAPLSIGRLVVDVSGDMAERQRLFHDDVAFVKAAKGRVLCQSFLLCFRAGQPIYFDPFNVYNGMAQGLYPPDLLIGMLKRHEIALMQVEDRRQHRHDDAPGRQAMPAFFVHFGDDVFDVLEREYKVAHVGIMGRFYVPRVAP